MGLAKGVNLTNVRAFVTWRFGAEAWENLVRQLSAADQATLATVISADWHDASLHGRIVRAMCDYLGDRDLSLGQELGRFEADLDLSTICRWFLRVVPPSFALRNMDYYWRRFNDTGHWTSEVSQHEIIARLWDWDVCEPALCQSLRGYLAAMLELFSGQKPIVEHPLCRCLGDKVCEFRTRCNVGEDKLQSGLVCSVEDIHCIARELALYTGLNELADAIMKLFLLHLSCSWVALAIVDSGTGLLRPLREAGDKGHGKERRIVLETRGRTVGRIDFTSLKAWPGDANIDLLDGFAPHLAEILAAMLPADTSLEHSRPIIRAEAVRRLTLASERWNLTPRQQRVLELIMLGKANKDIASTLDINEGTVEAHVTALLKKSTSGNRAELIAMFWFNL